MIPFSVEWEENCWALKDNPEALAELVKGKDYACKLKPIVKQGFKQLNLINFFTAGEKEVSVPLGPFRLPDPSWTQLPSPHPLLAQDQTDQTRAVLQAPTPHCALRVCSGERGWSTPGQRRPRRPG